ncbi:hypothetical protein [Priestia koreensis]|uniref:hypothetical protein n=1 Tax=Priestia koreensis TaxID=284581 RepID=UPI000A4FE996|nr:hypothetical protein [Priestia koreensis]
MRAIRWMLLGISMILMGGFILADSATSLAGIELLVMIIGFCLVLYGFTIKEENKK